FLILLFLQFKGLVRCRSNLWFQRQRAVERRGALPPAVEPFLSDGPRADAAQIASSAPSSRRCAPPEFQAPAVSIQPMSPASSRWLKTGTNQCCNCKPVQDP